MGFTDIFVIVLAAALVVLLYSVVRNGIRGDEGLLANHPVDHKYRWHHVPGLQTDACIGGIRFQYRYDKALVYC